MVFKEQIDLVFDKISKWFQTNMLLLNLQKTNFMQFSLKPNQRTDDLLGYRANFILNTRALLLLTAHCLGIYIMYKYVIN